MRWSILWIVLACFLFGSEAYAGGVFDATCRIQTPPVMQSNGKTASSYGTGTAYDIGERYVWVLTAGHVLEGCQTVKCEFWRDGHLSKQFAGIVAARSKHCDAGVVAIPKEAFSGILPATIPLAPSNMVLRRGDTILSNGCANGSWATAWRGHLIAVDGAEMKFTPTPAQGRSGSAILDSTGTRIIAVLVGQTLNAAKQPINGVAIPINRIRDHLRQEMQGQATYKPTQCKPGDQCYQGGSNGIMGGLLGNRPKNGGQIQIGNDGRLLNIERNPYPTLPQQPQIVPVQPAQPQIIYMPQPQQPVAPPVYQPDMPLPVPTEIKVDMSGVSEALGRQADAATTLSNSVSAYVDSQTAAIKAEQANATAGQAQGIVQAGVQGYQQEGVIGAVKYAALSEQTEEAAKGAASMFLPWPFDWIVIGALGVIFPFLRRWLLKKNAEETARIRTEALLSSARTPEDQLAEAKVIATAAAAEKLAATTPPTTPAT